MLVVILLSIFDNDFDMKEQLNLGLNFLNWP